MKDIEAYFHQPKPIEDLLKDSFIVVDTNVLLSAYQWREVTVNEVLRALIQLNDEDRLRIPLQVVKEFSKNRPKEIIQRINEIENELSKLQKQRPLNQIVPILEGRDSFVEVDEIQKQYNIIQKEYRNGLITLRDDLKALFYHDPYLDHIKEILQKAYYSPETNSEEELIKEAEKRFKKKLPPGYRDGTKEENKAGDFIIWDAMKKLKSNVIFVSGDKKTDWVHSDKQDNSVGARRELVEEFYNFTGGKDFAHLSPKEFISIINPEVSDVIKDDLSVTYSNEKYNELTIYEKMISDILFEYDPMQIIFEKEYQDGEYNSEARLISKTLSECNTKKEISDLVVKTFKEMFSGIGFAISESVYKRMIDEITDVRIKQKYGM
ncbi:PIN-like domain-containing protein [Peribacillus simplex]